MNPLEQIDRYFQTIRHLRPVQIYGRLWFSLTRPRIDASPRPALREMTGAWVAPARRRASMTGPEYFRLLNEGGSLALCGWDGPGRDRLWRYHQHYFEDLNAEGSATRSAWHHALIADWIAANPPASGTGWEPYPLSLRIVNWIRWALAGNALGEGALQSLAIQVRALAGRMEWHLLGNHLFANAKALVFAGLYFSGPEAGRWLERGRAVILRQIGEQVLPDGGHFELSPMYHAIALEDLLDLVNIMNAYPGTAGDALREACASRIPAMEAWLAAMAHPDQNISFFNDAAFGVAPAIPELRASARRLRLPPPADPAPLVFLRDSGYVRGAAGPAVLIADVGRIGPDHQPGHAHADTLSFELSLHGQRIFVNSGTSLYGNNPERFRQRGTAAHNTVIVCGQNSSEVWGSFRVARRAMPRDVSVEHASGTIRIGGAHDGYTRLPGRPIHRRDFTLTARSLRIEDRVTPEAPAEARFHLHPLAAIALGNTGEGAITLPDGGIVRWTASGGRPRLEPATWHPEFGLMEPTTCLALPLVHGQASLSLTWD